MTNPSPRPADLDILDVLRRRAAEMHQQVDTWLELTLRELGVELTELDVAHTLGVSFEPTVQLQRIPQDDEIERVSKGFFSTIADRVVEVLPGDDAQLVRFEIMLDGEAEPQLCELDGKLFDQLFRPSPKLGKAALKQREREPRLRYGLHPIYTSVALRYNTDGSITRGYFGDEGEFIEELRR